MVGVLMGVNHVQIMQPRLCVGPFQLVLRPDRRWALPGGGSATYFEVVILARRYDWRRPELVMVAVRYRGEVEGEFLAPNTATSNMANEQRP